MSDLIKRKGRKLNIGQNAEEEQDLRRGEHHWSHTLMLVGLFVGGLVTLAIAQFTVIETIDLWRMYIICGASGLLIPYRFYRKKLKLEYLEMVLGGLLGVGPIIMSFVLALNMLFAGTPQHMRFQIVHIEYIEKAFLSNNDVIIHLEGNAFEDIPELRSFDVYKTPEAVTYQHITYTIADGLFGFKVLKEIKFD